MDVATNGSTFELWRCFFFFQAEDGIRDLTVTGVQTCALPILVEERRADGDLRPLHQLREDREQRTPQHRERDPHEQEVVEEEARLAAHHRLELRFSREQRQARGVHREARRPRGDQEEQEKVSHIRLRERDRKSTRLNSSHSQISYAVFCLKKKKTHLVTNSCSRRRQ